jgi:hypothetical protein
VSQNGDCYRPAPDRDHPAGSLHRVRMDGAGVSRAIAALAARYVGRRVRLRQPVDTGTIARITGAGVFITIGPITGGDIAAYLDD